jgi:hypothetical protein
MLKRKRRAKVLPQAPMGHPDLWLGVDCWVHRDGGVQRARRRSGVCSDDY